MRKIGILFLIIVYVISIAIDAYIFYDIKTYLKGRAQRVWLWIHGVFTALCLCLLTAIVCWPTDRSSSSLVPVMWMIYTYASIYISKLFYLFLSSIGRLFKCRRSGRKVNYGIYAGIPVAAVVFIILWWGVFFTRYDIDVNRVTITSPRVPEGFDGYRIVQFSDAHVGTWGSDTTFIASLVDSVNSLQPDMIVFTGDIVNRETSELKPFLKPLSRLKARDGVYSILGNHDHGDYMKWDSLKDKEADMELLMNWQKQMGWKLLVNSHEQVVNNGDTLMLIGVDNWGEPPFLSYGRLAEAYEMSPDSAYNVNDGRFKLLLSHNPEHWKREVSRITNIDLTLSGHTHAMQAMVKLGGREWSPASWKYEYWGGLYSKESKAGEPMNLYVNIGSGEVGMPSRLGAAKPEITEITLKRDSK